MLSQAKEENKGSDVIDAKRKTHFKKEGQANSA